ncbi:MAG: AAA family ATPase [Ketobacteraceae bacterium]|nr:AAA family ATPase [Ketobacteraceae bacterium]
MNTRWTLTLALWLGCLLLATEPALSSSSGSMSAGTTCSEVALSELQREVLALESIYDNFQNLAGGDLAPEFSLSSVFTINLLDRQDVNSRIQELNLQTRPSGTAYSQCPSPAFREAAQKRNELARKLSQIRLSYLQLSLEERRYLNSLITVFLHFQSRYRETEKAIETRNIRTVQLQEQRSAFESAFQTQQDPKERASLSETILALDQKLEAIARTQRKDQRQKQKLERLLALSRGLLIDYHLVYIDSGNVRSAVHGIRPFNSLVNSTTLKQLLTPSGEAAPEEAAAEGESRPAQAKPLATLGSREQANLAALLIISSRIYSEKRDLLGVMAIRPGSNVSFAETLSLEFKTLLALPSANLHLKFTEQENDYSYLSRNFFQSATHLLTQIIVAVLLWAYLKRVRNWVYSLQRYLVKNHLGKRFSRFMIGVLRILQPNAAWLSAVAFFYYLNQREQDELRDLILLYDITAIMAFYLFVNTLITWAISNTNSQAHLFVTKSRQDTIASYCHHYAFYVTLFSLVYIVLNNILHGGIITVLYALALIVIIWQFTYRLIQHFSGELDTHLSKRVSETTHQRYKNVKLGFVRQGLVPVTFFALQFRDLVTGIHNRLLNIESYHALTAKFLKIRLEQSQTSNDSGEKPAQEDIHYESWFLNRDLPAEKPQLLLKSRWIKDINTMVLEWMEQKQEENDLALIGECGIGKTILINQWLDQWESCKAVNIVVPEKTTNEDDIFNLIKEAIGISTKADIAHFVKEQKDLEKTVVVIDEAQNLFLGDVGGFNAYKMLQNLISAKLQNIFWIVAINQQSWIYLNDVFSRTYQFSNRINIQRWTQQEIRELILNRHRASRRRLKYDELLLASTAHSETATRAAESRCFSLLWDQSAGIPAVALSIWVNAARHPGKGQIEMGIPERPSSSVMLELTDDYLFVYSALIIHETLNTQQAQAVTHLSEPIVRRALKLGMDQGFVIRKDRGRYTINSLWYIQLCQLLRRKNFLHE